MCKNLIKRLFRPDAADDEEQIERKLEQIRSSINRAGAKIERSILTINGEEEKRFLCFVKNKDNCHAK